MTDKTIGALPAITIQSLTDLYEVSLDGSGSVKETRSQSLSYINANAQLASTSQVTGLNTALSNLLPKNNPIFTGTITGGDASLAQIDASQIVNANDGLNIPSYSRNQFYVAI